MEVTRVPPGRPSCTTSGTRTTGWEPCLAGSAKMSQLDFTATEK